MRVKINITGRDPFWLEVEPYYSFETVKKKLEHLHKIPSGQQILYHNSEEKLNHYTISLKQSLVKDGDTFTIRIDKECFDLSCQTPRRTLNLQVRASDTIKVLKQAVFKFENICPEIQCIVMNGIELKDECHLSDYNINSDIIKGREPFWLEVAPYYSILIVKRKLEHLYDIPVSHQSIIYNSQAIINESTILSKHCVKDEDTFKIRLDSDFFNLHCSETKECWYGHKVKHSYTIRKLKDMIYAGRYTPPHMQKLMLNGQELDDERNLAYYNITTSSTIVVNTNFEPMGWLDIFSRLLLKVLLLSVAHNIIKKVWPAFSVDQENCANPS
ncbi:hypothetical protein BD770DRAFT_407640 [Pilaira anomala]|nr:hypothetical protein BD770DRAFT_407640 [Pilaira anomala]